MARHVDKPFLYIVITLALVGFFVFSSAAMGAFARNNIPPLSLILTQLISLVLGFVFLYIFSRIPYQFWNKTAFYLLLASLILTILVFIPQLSFTHGGATRWLDFGFITFQPSELLKFAFVIYFAAWLAGARRKIHKFAFSSLPLVILLGITGAILVAQPDIDTFLVIAGTGIFMLIAAGGKWRHVLALFLGGIILSLILALTVSHVRSRIDTFLNPGDDPLGSGYQLNQSLIAVGSGGVFGRGFGQSVQKFTYLPEAVGDSIFAVFAEEWGFVGAVTLLALFVLFALRGFRIAARAPSIFAGVLTIGIVSMIIIQSLLNISAMIGLFPLSGLPLLFISQGGSALVITLMAVGIVLGISRQMRKN